MRRAYQPVDVRSPRDLDGMVSVWGWLKSRVERDRGDELSNNKTGN
jgi:hypothetical protein